MTRLGDMLPVRFAIWPKSWCAALLVILIGLTSLSVALPVSHSASYAKSQEDYSDNQLYRDIAARVTKGETYYDAAALEQRAHGYPLHPFITVRLPTLAMIIVLFGEGGYATLPGIIGLIAAGVWGYRVYAQSRSLSLAVLCALPICAATTVLGFTKLTLLHECGAALLLCLTIGLRTAERYVGAALISLLAVLIRETAIAVPLMMMLFAGIEKRFREAATWASVVVIFGLFLGWHALMISQVTRPTDLTSPGWGGALGWSYAVEAIRAHSVLALLPYSVAALTLPLALFGWLFWQSPLALRGFGVVIGYTLMVALLARENTPYWAIMATPLLLTGVVIAVPILASLVIRTMTKVIPQREIRS